METSLGKCRRGGFTLVELLVVIAIIGILVALLLPAIQAARESARRTQCMNQVRQMTQAMHNHVDTYKVFPTGGVAPWPFIEYYSTNGKPFGVKKQGFSWAFQILPFLEENAVHNITTTQQLEQTPVALYFCPSRRPPTQSEESGRWLMDYAALVPLPARWQLTGLLVNNALKDPDGDGIAAGCGNEFLWTPAGQHSSFSGKGGGFGPLPLRPEDRNNPRFQYWGVITRGPYFREGTLEWNTNFTAPVSFARIIDGASNTAVVTEKRVNPTTYQSGSGPPDDRGWSDGWDFDTMRLSSCFPYQDTATITNKESFELTTGSAHSAGINCGFADGSVRFLSFDIDLETFNRMAHRSDGEVSTSQ
jgi:prepilin-type N-terminal cleavage/methylation domain-containing protein/prepilin-type processing-associated H-X9-DG protein